MITHRTSACDAMPAFEAALAAGSIAVGSRRHRCPGVAQPGRRRSGWRSSTAKAGCWSGPSGNGSRSSRPRAATRSADSSPSATPPTVAIPRRPSWSGNGRRPSSSNGSTNRPGCITPTSNSTRCAVRSCRRRSVTTCAEPANVTPTPGTPWNQLEVDSFVDAVQAGVTRKPPPTPTNNLGDGAPPPSGLEDLEASRTCRCGTAVAEQPFELRIPEAWCSSTRPRCWTAGTNTASVKHTTAPRSRSPRCAECVATPRSCPPSSTATVKSPTSGRSTRTVNRAQRRQLRAMHKTCGGDPACTVPFEQCEIHHVIFWRFLGETNIDNLLPLCSRHHHQAHEGGWTLSMTPDRTITWTRPDGTTHSTDPASTAPPTASAPTSAPTQQRRRTDTRPVDRCLCMTPLSG